MKYYLIPLVCNDLAISTTNGWKNSLYSCSFSFRVSTISTISAALPGNLTLKVSPMSYGLSPFVHFTRKLKDLFYNFDMEIKYLHRLDGTPTGMLCSQQAAT